MPAINSIEEIQSGGKKALSDALARIEARFDERDVINLLDDAFSKARAHVIGITGPPGVGKSTLTNELIKQWRSQKRTVGVIAVDPSSKVSGGALLGDRTRMLTDPDDQGVFIRSFASRGQLGGLSELTFPALVIMRALFDVLLVETVGVGQSEAEVSGLADTVILCVQPGSGDGLQFMKSGIMEIPDIVIVTKGDMGLVAEQAFADLKGALSLQSGRSGSDGVPVLLVSSLSNMGIDEVIATLDARFEQISEKDGSAGKAGLHDVRLVQAENWIKGNISRRFGEAGLKLVGSQIDTGENMPFMRLQEMITGLESRFN